jgi:urea transporter/murein DD-endopeptidase MepM/ murein hydrolase activator NlpD
MMQNPADIFRNKYLQATLNSYSIVFFFNNRLFGIILLVVTFFNFFAGLTGLIAVLATIAIAGAMNFDESKLKQGIYSFNSLLTGLGMGTFFDPGLAFFIFLLLAVLFSLILSVVLDGWLGKKGLPFLSIPFVISFWIILLPSGQFANLGLTQRNIFWMNEMYSRGGKTLLDFFQAIEGLRIDNVIVVYLRSLSSIVFQDNILTGILIAVSLLIASRIAFLLSATGFFTAFLFAHTAGSDMTGFSFYNIGANYILVAIAAGGFFTIPSKHSFIWVVLLVPLTSLLIIFLTSLIPGFKVPFFSLPFSLIVILFVYFLKLRIRQGKPELVTYQNYSPEVNLYNHTGNAGRLAGNSYFPLLLPFWGEWTVSQGYDGKYTHKGDWGKAVDFVLTDDLGHTHGLSDGSCGDYYCYNKHITAPADGIIAEIIDHVDDNEPGKVNSTENWGNTVIIKHLNNLYSQISHLRPGSFKVNKGDFIRQGEIIARCGNSGRSPEPHIHFQVQSAPLTRARTISYPFSYFLQRKENSQLLRSFCIPSEGDLVSNVITTQLLKNAFDLQPGVILKFRSRTESGKEKEIKWEVFTDTFNNRYLYCYESRSSAFFVNDGTMFYFTSFYGDRNSLLYFFYLTAYKVLLGYYEKINISDIYPLHIVAGNKLLLYIHDFIAPFHQFVKVRFSGEPVWADSAVEPSGIRLKSEIHISWFSFRHEEGSGSILLSGNQINAFSFESRRKKIWAQRINI